VDKGFLNGTDIAAISRVKPRGSDRYVHTKAGVLNCSPRDPLLCILCMSPLFKTPDSDPPLITIDMHNMQSSGLPGLALKGFIAD